MVIIALLGQAVQYAFKGTLRCEDFTELLLARKVVQGFSQTRKVTHLPACLLSLRQKGKCVLFRFYCTDDEKEICPRMTVMIEILLIKLQLSLVKYSAPMFNSSWLKFATCQPKKLNT